MVFRQVGNDTDNLIDKLGLLNKSFADIKRDFQNGQGLRSLGNFISNQDVENFKKFNSEFEKVGFHKAFNDNLATSHSYIQKQAVAIRRLNTEQYLLKRQFREGKITQEQYNTALQSNQAQITALTTKTQALTLAQKASAVASKAASVALNMIGNIAIMAGINLIITGITKLVNKQKELREASEESANKYKEQTQSLKDLRQQYIDIVDSENDVSKKTEELNEWKQTLIETYGFEKEALENVNLEREKGLGLLDAEIAANNRKSRNTYLEENKSNIQKAYAELGKSSTDIWYSQIADETDGISKRITKLFDNISTKELSYGIQDVNLSLDYDDEYDRLDKLKNLYNEFVELERDRSLTDSESRLFQWVKNEKKAAEDAIANLGTYYETASKYNAQNLIEDYIKTDDGKLENVGKDTFLSWQKGLLSQAKNAGERNELSKYIEEQFPDYAKYFENLAKARQKFAQPLSANQYEVAWAKEKDAFLESLSPEDLEAALNIPDLFADGLEGATKKIEEWNKNNPISPDVSIDETKLSEVIETTSKKVKLITTAMEEMNDTGSISSSTYGEIVEMGGNFADCLEIQNGKLKLNVQKLKELERQEILNAIAAKNLAISELNVSAAMAGQARDAEKVEEIRKQITALEEERAVLWQINDEIANAKPNESGSGGSGGSGGKEEKLQSVLDFEKEYARRQHEIAMGRMKEDEDYYKWLESAAKTAFEGLEDYQDDLWKYEEEVYKGRKQLAEDFYDEQQKLFEDRVSNLETNIEVATKYSTDADGNKLDIEEKYDYISSAYQEIINEINARIGEILDAGIEGHEEEVANLEKQIEEYQEKLSDVFKSAVEEEQDYIEKQKDAYSDLYDERIDKIKEQQKVAEEAAQAEIDAVQEKIDVLKEANEKAEEANEIEKARQELANASQRTRQVYGADGSISFQVDQDKVKEAQEKLDKLLQEQQINILEEQKQTLEDAKNKASESYDRIIENLETEKENGEKRFDILLDVLDRYLNPDNGESNSDVWKTLAHIEGAIYKDGTWKDKDGNVIDIDKLLETAKNEDKQTDTDNKTKDNPKDDTVISGKLTRQDIGDEESDIKDKTESAIETFFSNLEKKLNMPSGSINLENAMQVFRNSPMMNFNPYGAMNDRTGLANKEYVNNVNNNNNAANITVGDIVINNPVGNSDDLAKELALNIPIAFQKQMYSNLK